MTTNDSNDWVKEGTPREDWEADTDYGVEIDPAEWDDYSEEQAVHVPTPAAAKEYQPPAEEQVAEEHVAEEHVADEQGVPVEDAPAAEGDFAGATAVDPDEGLREPIESDEDVREPVQEDLFDDRAQERADDEGFAGATAVDPDEGRPQEAVDEFREEEDFAGATAVDPDEGLRDDAGALDVEDEDPVLPPVEETDTVDGPQAQPTAELPEDGEPSWEPPAGTFDDAPADQPEGFEDSDLEETRVRERPFVPPVDPTIEGEAGEEQVVDNEGRPASVLDDVDGEPHVEERAEMGDVDPLASEERPASVLDDGVEVDERADDRVGEPGDVDSFDDDEFTNRSEHTSFDDDHFEDELEQPRPRPEAMTGFRPDEQPVDEQLDDEVPADEQLDDQQHFDDRPFQEERPVDDDRDGGVGMGAAAAGGAAVGAAGVASLYRDDSSNEATQTLDPVEGRDRTEVMHQSRLEQEQAEEEARLARLQEQRDARDARLGVVPGSEEGATREVVRPMRRQADRPLGAFALLVLRFVTAAVIGVLGYQVLQDVDGAANFLGNTVIPEPRLVAWILGFGMVAMAALLVLGLGVRIVGFVLLAVAIASLATIRWGSFSIFYEGMEGFFGDRTLLTAAVALIFIAFGAGRASIDGAIYSARENSRATNTQ